MEQQLPGHGPVLRAGYAWEIPDGSEPLQPGVRDPCRFSLGMGFQPSRHLGLDIGYQYGGSSNVRNSQVGGPPDLSLKAEQQQVMASMSYDW